MGFFCFLPTCETLRQRRAGSSTSRTSAAQERKAPSFCDLKPSCLELVLRVQDTPAARSDGTRFPLGRRKTLLYFLGHLPPVLADGSSEAPQYSGGARQVIPISSLSDLFSSP